MRRTTSTAIIAAVERLHTREGFPPRLLGKLFLSAALETYAHFTTTGFPPRLLGKFFLSAALDPYAHCTTTGQLLDLLEHYVAHTARNYNRFVDSSETQDIGIVYKLHLSSVIGVHRCI